LSIPQERDGGLPGGAFRLYLTVKGVISSANLTATDLNHDSLSVTFAGVTALTQQGYSTVSLDVSSTGSVSAEAVDRWVRHLAGFFPNMELACARASRPGYFIRWYRGVTGDPQQEYDFEIFCPNPDCDLRQEWCEGMPFGWKHGAVADNT